MKTDILIRANGEQCRVKLDANKFPYIVIQNEKIIINSIEFPRDIKTCYGLMEVKMELIAGQEELEKILNNPNLTVDKLSLRQQMRVG